MPYNSQIDECLCVKNGQIKKFEKMKNKLKIMKNLMLSLLFLVGFFITAQGQRVVCDYKVFKSKDMKDFVTIQKTYILDLDLIKKKIKIYDNGDSYTISGINLVEENKTQWIFSYHEEKILIITKNFDSFYFSVDIDTYIIYFKSDKLMERHDK